MKKRTVLSLIFLIVGVAIYLLFDLEIMAKQSLMFSIIRNFLPDLCWTLSFFFMSINFSSKIVKNNLLFNSLYVLGIALIYELLQYFKVIKGTFDVLDILIYIIAIATACLIEKMIRRKENGKN